MKKMHSLFAALLVVAGLGLAACGDDDTGGYTYSAADLPMDVPGDGSYTNSFITVTGAPTTISKITVNVTISHTRTGQLLIELYGPHYTTGTNGATSLAWGSGDNNVPGGYHNVKFDDAAPNSIVGAIMPSGGYTGTYRPRLSFHTFLGSDANGEWRLAVLEDLASSVNGQITAWSITFE